MPSRGVVAAVVGLVAGVAVALAVFFPDRVGLDGRTPFAQLAAITPMLLVLLGASVFVGRLVGIAIGSLRRRRRPPLEERRPHLFSGLFAAMIGAAAVALVAAGVVGSRLFGEDLPPVPPGAPELSVLVLNVEHGRADVDALATLLRDTRPDLVALPEGGDAFRERLAPRIADLGYRAWTAEASSPEDGDTTTLLAAPGIGDPQVRTVPGSLFGWVEATLPGGLRMVALHATAPVPFQIGGHEDDMAQVAAWCDQSQTPTIVAGDFNGTQDMRAFREASVGCRNALPAVGSGTIATWPTAFPRWFGLQLDHVLVTGGVEVRSAEVLDMPGTDHRGILASLTVPG